MKKLMIVHSHPLKIIMQKLLGDDWVVLSVGENTCGYHFSEAVIASGLAGASIDWLDQIKSRIHGHTYYL